MASKRHQRMKACNGKKKYATEDLAHSAKRAAIKRTQDNIRAYLCGNCGRWHIGHWNARKLIF